jgi:hypothetical protein
MVAANASGTRSSPRHARKVNIFRWTLNATRPNEMIVDKILDIIHAGYTHNTDMSLSRITLTRKIKTDKVATLF